MCVNLKYIHLTKLRHSPSYFLISLLVSCTRLRPRALERSGNTHCTGPDLRALQRELSGEAASHPGHLESQGLGINRTAGGKEQEVGFPGCQGRPGAKPSPAPHQVLVRSGNNAVLAPASRILHPKPRHLSGPVSFPSPGFRFPQP